MTPADMPALDPYLIALIDGNMLSAAFIAAFFAAMAKAAAAMSKRTEGTGILEWLAAISSAFFGALNFRKRNGKDETDKTATG